MVKEFQEELEIRSPPNRQDEFWEEEEAMTPMHRRRIEIGKEIEMGHTRLPVVHGRNG